MLKKLFMTVVIVLASAGCSDTGTPQLIFPSPEASVEIAGHWFARVAQGTRLDGMPKDTFGFIDTADMYVNPKPSSDGKFEWRQHKETSLAPTLNNLQVVQVTFDGTTYTIDGAAACKQIAEQRGNLKEHWRAHGVTSNDPRSFKVVAQGETCSTDMK